MYYTRTKNTNTHFLRKKVRNDTSSEKKIFDNALFMSQKFVNIFFRKKKLILAIYMKVKFVNMYFLKRDID